MPAHRGLGRQAKAREADGFTCDQNKETRRPRPLLVADGKVLASEMTLS